MVVCDKVPQSTFLCLVIVVVQRSYYFKGNTQANGLCYGKNLLGRAWVGRAVT